MTILKLTKSRKAIQVITDEGKVYQTSVNSMTYLLNMQNTNGFITTTRLPFNVSPTRYKPSEIWTDGGRIDPRSVQETHDGKSSQDGHSIAFTRKQEQTKQYRDIYSIDQCDDFDIEETKDEK